jgi:hypothetical protein
MRIGGAAQGRRGMAWALVVATACGGADAPEPRARAGRAASAAPVGKGLLSSGSLSPLPPSVADGPARSELPDDQPGLVVFVVLDTVRAQSVALCGYERATTKVLQTLVEKGAQHTCRAYSPATWTIPSHASYFTGLDTADHDLHKKGLRLPDSATTLAEIYQARGYQTVLLSANPVLKEATGLQQGFLRAMVPMGLVSPMRGAEGLVGAARQVLGEADARKPLFLFLNIFEAHDPYPAVPAGVAGIPQQDAFAYQLGVTDESNPWVRLHRGTLVGAEREQFLGRARAGYDYGVSASDRVLGRILKLLEDRGWTDHGVRLVVTSDHGELLGEHDMMRHGQAPFEELARVPFLFYDTTAATPIALPEPFPAIAAFELIRSGKLPEALPEARSMSMKYGESTEGRFHDAVAVWPTVTRKLFWRDGEAAAFDLGADPGEAAPLQVEGAEVAMLHQAVLTQQAAKARALSQQVDGDAVKGLEALGYVGE